VNVKAILQALKAAPEGEFVTVQEPGNDVRVAKEHGQLVVHVIDKDSKEIVDVTLPWDVAQALISNTGENELDLEAAIKALANAGDITLVTVSSREENVRVWIDSNSAEKECVTTTVGTVNWSPQALPRGSRIGKGTSSTCARLNSLPMWCATVGELWG